MRRPVAPLRVGRRKLTPGSAVSNLRLAWMLTNRLLGVYQPLAWLSYALDHALWGFEAYGYHVTNVLLHALNAALVFSFLRGGARAQLSTIAVCGFAIAVVHPTYAVFLALPPPFGSGCAGFPRRSSAPTWGWRR